MKPHPAAAPIAALILSAIPLLASPQPFAHENSDLKPESGLRFNRLPNGLRTVVCANAEPKGRASLRLVVFAGSLMETEDQRGLAHFTEHMAFNGTRHFPAETLVRYFQRLGMGLGDDAGAFTYYDHTTYVIELPDNKPESFSEGLLVFSDYASGMLFEQKDIDKERGVILSELRARDSIGLRTELARLDFLYRGTLLPKRIPIGLKEVISFAPRERFLDFYQRWYRPERMALVAVGDFNPELVEEQITKAFGDLKPAEKQTPEPDYGKIPESEDLQIRFHQEHEAPSTNISLSAVRSFEPEKDCSAVRVREFSRRLALAMFNQRLLVLSLKEGAPFLRAETGYDSVYRCAREAVVSIDCRAEQWEAALGVAEYELRRALEQGFQEDEFRQASAAFTNRLEQAAKSAATRHSAGLANVLVDDLLEDFVSTSPEDDLALFRSVSASLDTRSCTEALRECWKGPGRHLFVSGNAVIPGNAEESLRGAYQRSAARPLEARDMRAEARFDYTDFGPAGKVCGRNEVKDLGIVQITFENGVRLNLKRTDFEADSIRVQIRIGDGQLLEPKNKPGIGLFSNAVLVAGGLGRAAIDDLQRALAGHTLGLDFQVSSDALQFFAGTNQRDLLLQLQLLCAFTQDPGFRPEALRLARQNFEQMYSQIEHQPEGPLSTEVPCLLACGDTRFGVPPAEILYRYTVEDARSFLESQFRSGPVEISLVGDLDEKQAIDFVARSFGALPKRGPRTEHSEEKKVSFPAPFKREFQVDTRIPKALLCVYWKTDDASDMGRTRRLGLLTDILRDRLFNKIREDKGEAYTPQAENYASDTYTNYGYISSVFPVDPEQADALTEAVVKVASELADKGPSEDELLRARKPLLTAIAEAQRNNGHWLSNVLSRSQEKPQVLAWQRESVQDTEAVTIAELQDLAKKYLSPEKAVRITIRPK